MILWRDEIASPPDPWAIPAISQRNGFDIDVSAEPRYSRPVENDPLFADLRNHLRPGLFQRWAKYKARLDEYIRHRRSWVQSVIDLARRATGLEICGTSSTPQRDTLMTRVLPHLFEDLRNKARDEEPRVFGHERPQEARLDRQGLWLAGNLLIFCPDQDKCESYYRALCQVLGEEDGRRLAEDIRQQQVMSDGLATERQPILDELDELVRIPIFANECTFIRKGAR